MLGFDRDREVPGAAAGLPVSTDEISSDGFGWLEDSDSLGVAGCDSDFAGAGVMVVWPVLQPVRGSIPTLSSSVSIRGLSVVDIAFLGCVRSSAFMIIVSRY